MCPESITINGGDTRSFDAALRSVQVGVGSLIVTDGHDSVTVKEPDTHDCADKASLALYSPEGAVASVTYSNELPAPQEPTKKVSGVHARPARKARKARKAA